MQWKSCLLQVQHSCTTTVQEIASRSFASKQAADAEDGQMKQKSVSVTHENVFDGQKKQKSVSVTHENVFDEHINPKDYPTLQAKQISVESDKASHCGSPSWHHQTIKEGEVSWHTQSCELQWYYNDATTSLVKVPCCYAKQSGFKQQARRTRWVHWILQSVRRYNAEDVVDGVGKEKKEVDEEFAYSDDNAARWLLMTYLGECYPSEFVKYVVCASITLDMPIHQGKIHAEYTTASHVGRRRAAHHHEVFPWPFLATNVLLLKQQSNSWLSIRYHQSLVPYSIWTVRTLDHDVYTTVYTTAILLPRSYSC
jgi:hypothetical protein